jgi:hypothetical protein
MTNSSGLYRNMFVWSMLAALAVSLAQQWLIIGMIHGLGTRMP